MAIIEFELFNLPHAADTPVEGYYPVVVSQNKIDENTICEQAEKSTTLHAADVKAVLSFLVRYIVERLACGDRVELPDFGTFGLRIGSDKPITDCDNLQIARNLKIRGINFTPKMDLILAIGNDLHFRRADAQHRTTPKLADEELVKRIQAFLATGHSPLFTRADIQFLTGYSKTRALRNLKDWIERGILIKFGSPRSPYYCLAPEFTEEQQADDPETQQ